MFSKPEIIKYQLKFFNIWPPKHYFFINGWILAFTGGVTGRSNSVLTVNYSGTDLAKDISLVESAYSKFHLPVRFKISDCLEPPELEDELLKRGYIYSDYSIISMGSNNISIKGKLNEELVYKFANDQTPEFSHFLETYSSNYTEDQQIMVDITQRLIIPKKLFILAMKEKKIVGSVMVVLDPQGSMYVAELFVHPEYRRQQIGFSLLKKAILLGKNSGATSIWLHVEKENTKALALYRKLGFRILYSYRYLLRESAV
ncbi:MAG: GNAT family N-acetyltransferase [Promethearchaeota archaeon]